MFDFMQMANSPLAREKLFKMMSRQMGQSPPDVKEAILKVGIAIKRNERGLELRPGKSGHHQVGKMLQESTDSWRILNRRAKGRQRRPRR